MAYNAGLTSFSNTYFHGYAYFPWLRLLSMATPTEIVAYLALFTAVGFLFLFANLMMGWLVRPKAPNKEKSEIYECGEPAIGSSFVQFDIRFYVVALVFIVFDAEVAFLFPAATVFGKQTQLAEIAGSEQRTMAEAAPLFQEMQISPPNANRSAAEISAAAQKFTWFVYAATLIFFAVLFVGFAYEWKTGAFDWVRAITSQRTAIDAVPCASPVEQPVLAR